MRKKSFLKKGAWVIAIAALVGAMVPAMALADTQTSAGGSTEVTSENVEVIYDKDCAWTATYPTSVALTNQADGTAYTSIDFNVKGLIDVDHQVTITPSDATINLTGLRHGGTLVASITGGVANASDVNTTAGASVSGSASATAEAVNAAAVDTYKGTTTFKIKCAGTDHKVNIHFAINPTFLETCTITGLDENNNITVPDGALVAITGHYTNNLVISFTKDSTVKTFSISKAGASIGFMVADYDSIEGSTITEDKTISIGIPS